MPFTSALADYGVVLGSYAQRDIAIRELRQLQPAPTPLFIAVAQPAGGTYYRIMAGPYGLYGDASDAQALWQGRGLTDAWVSQLETAPQTLDETPVPSADLAEDIDAEGIDAEDTAEQELP